MADETELTEEEKVEEDLREELLESLANSIQSKFELRAAKRAGKENQWLRAARLYYGKLAIDNYYSKPESPFTGVAHKDRPDVNIVRSKCSIAIAQTVSMQFGTGNKNWDLWPDPGNTDPMAVDACQAMSDTIEQQLEESKYSLEARRAMWDRVVLGTGILKGPNSIGEMKKTYRLVEGTSTWVPDVHVEHKPTVIRVNPWFLYPDETTEDSSNLQDTIEVHPMTALELKKLLKHDGFIPEAIEKVLEQKPKEYNASNWADYALLSDNNPNLYKNRYVVMEYHGPITRTQLELLSIEPAYDSLNDEYYGEVWVCQGQIIRIELETIEASFRVPYYISVWEKDPGYPFGFGVPLMMEDAQRVVNEAWHMILDNTSISSGPQVAMHKHLIEPANGKWEFAPRQIWHLTDEMMDVQKAIQFFDVPNVTPNIIPILDMARMFSEEESQIPLISAGLASPEVGDTATGQLMIHQSSTTLLDFMSEEWDDNITGPLIEAFYAWNMQYNNDPSIKGNYQVDVRTSTQYKNKQLHIRDLEKLSVEAANNPDMAIHINQGELQRVRLDMMSLPSKTIIRSREEVEQILAEQQNAPPPPEILELELSARKVALEEAKLDFETTLAQQREAWEHEERMEANAARFVEAQARVTVSQNEKETEIIKLMQRSEETAARLMSNERIVKENNMTKAFLKGLEETRKERELDLVDKELDLAHRIGKGI